MKVARCFRQRIALTIASLGGLLIAPCLLSCNLVDTLAPSFQTSGPASCATGIEPAPQRDACAFGQGASPSETIACPDSGPDIPVQHIIVLMQENRSFDHYLGHLPGHGQDDVDVAPAGTSNPLPPGVTDGSGSTVVPWTHGTSNCFDNPNHSWSGSHRAWNQGANDGFVIASGTPNDDEGNDPTGSRAMTYYDDSDLPFYYQLASTFAISDRYFSEVLGPTFPNRLYLYAGSSFGIVGDDIDTDLHRTIFGCPQRSRDLLEGLRIRGARRSFDRLIRDRFDRSRRRHRRLRRGCAAGSAAGGVLGRPGLPDRRGDAELRRGAGRHAGRPAVRLPSGQRLDVQPQLGDIGDVHHLRRDRRALRPRAPARRLSPRRHTALGAADLGGFDRHGFRVPFFVVSPYARAHFVSHAVHSHTSILRFIETRFGLPALSARDANADALLDMFDFASPPFLSPPDLQAPTVDAAQLAACSARYGR